MLTQNCNPKSSLSYIEFKTSLGYKDLPTPCVVKEKEKEGKGGELGDGREEGNEIRGEDGRGWEAK